MVCDEVQKNGTKGSQCRHELVARKQLNVAHRGKVICSPDLSDTDLPRRSYHAMHSVHIV